MSKTRHIVCPHCIATNRIPVERDTLYNSVTRTGDSFTVAV